MKAILATLFMWLSILSLGLIFYVMFSALNLTAWKVTPTSMAIIVLAAFASMLLAYKLFDKIGGGK